MPARMRMSVIDSTAARLTARFRQKLCQALLSANLRFRNNIVIPASTVISCNLSRIDGDDAAAQKVDDLAVVRRHDHGGAARVDAQKELHDLPRRRRVEVPCRLVGDDESWSVHQRARNRDSLLLAARQVSRVRVL